MAVTVILDLIQGSSIKNVPGHLMVTRPVQVYGLTAGTADQMSYQALTATGMPRVGDVHPHISGLYVGSVDLHPATASSPDQWEGSVVYENLNVSLLNPSTSTPAQISIGSTVQEMATNLDQASTKMQVTYSGSENSNVSTVYNVEPVQVQKPVMVARYTRLEPSSPQINAIAYVGCVNSGTFLGDAAKTWLCTKIDGTSQDGGVSFTVNYEFQRANTTAGWQALLLWFDPATGKPGSTVDVDGTGSGNGRALKDVYPSADFSSLTL